MSNQTGAPARAAATAARAGSAFALTLLAVEFLDELAFGTREAAWPLVRTDLRLTYTQIGLLMSAPAFISNLLELPLGILGDTHRRRALVLAGGACFAAGLLLVALGHSFAAMFLALTVLSPAAGAFVGLSQATLMDADPARREQNMARWAFAGSLGQVSGSLALALAVSRGFGWRDCFAALALVALAVTLLARRHYPAAPTRSPDEREDKDSSGDDDAAEAAEADGDASDDNDTADDKDEADDNDEAGGGVEADEEGGAPARAGGLAAGFAEAWRALRRREVLRWLALLELADLTLDGFHGFIALYFADVVGLADSRAALTVAVWVGVGLAGDLLVIPLLERVRGLSYLRASAAAVALVFPAFLLAPGVAPKLALLGLLGVLNAGWYSILKAQLYAALPGRSGAVMTLNSAAGLLSGLVPGALGLFAEAFGLAAMMWLLLAGPLSLLALISRAGKNRRDVLG